MNSNILRNVLNSPVLWWTFICFHLSKHKSCRILIIINFSITANAKWIRLSHFPVFLLLRKSTFALSPSSRDSASFESLPLSHFEPQSAESYQRFFLYFYVSQIRGDGAKSSGAVKWPLFAFSCRRTCDAQMTTLVASWSFSRITFHATSKKL